MTAAARPLDAAIENAPSMRIGALRLRLHHNSGAGQADIPDRTALCRAIDDALRDTLPEDDGSYWVVRRIALPFRAEPRFGMNGIAEGFALALRGRIGRILRGEDIDGVLRYASRAHWLAECIWAQAQGDARDAWQFGRYRHHAALPAASAVRLTLAQEAGLAAEAIALLARDGRIRPFCARLGDGGARGILSLLVPARPATGGTIDPELARLLDEEAARSADRPHIAKLTALARHAGRRPGAALPDAARLNRAFAHALARIVRGPRPADGLPDPVSAPYPAATDTPAPPSRPADGGMDAEVTPARHIRPSNAPIVAGFAGVFALWRSACELGLPDLLSTGAARLALAAAMAGPEHGAAWRDPALHWLAGYCPEPGEAPPDPPPDLAARFARHYRAERGFRGIAPTMVAIGRTTLLQARESEDWLALGSQRHCEGAARLFDTAPTPPAPAARDPAIDLDWFGVRHRKARRPWVLLARAAYGDFGRRLHGLAGASAAWLWHRLLAGEGVLEFGAPATLHLPRAQLDLVLRMGGLDGTLVMTSGGEVRLILPGSE